MKSIILAGGTARRLYPLTVAVNKHLLPVQNKPMVYYPLTTLIASGFRDVILVSGSSHLEQFASLLGDGSQWGISIEYALQPDPHGIAHALRACEPLIREDSVAVILGDNVFLGEGLPSQVEQASRDHSGAHIFIKQVPDPTRYGIAMRAPDGRVLALEEKPRNPKSNDAVTGLYLYDEHLVSILHRLRPSQRGEYEITAVNQAYLQEQSLSVTEIPAGDDWFDAGTPCALRDAAEVIGRFESEGGYWVGCPESAALRRGYITDEDIRRVSTQWKGTLYGDYLAGLVQHQENLFSPDVRA